MSALLQYQPLVLADYPSGASLILGLQIDFDRLLGLYDVFHARFDTFRLFECRSGKCY